MDTYLQWKEIEARLREGNCIDTINQRLMLQEIQQGRVDVCEHFIEFIPLQNTTGAGMAEILSTTLEKHGLLLSNIRGQGYDNGANMSGKNNGVQSILTTI